MLCCIYGDVVFLIMKLKKDNELIGEAKKKPWCKIVFQHQDAETGATQEVEFTSFINPLTGDRLTSFNSRSPQINYTLAEVRNVIVNIRKKGKVISEEGSLNLLEKS